MARLDLLPSEQCCPRAADTIVRPLPARSLPALQHDVFVEVRWAGRTLAIPLIQLEVLDADVPTRQAVEDWRYWVERGYQW